MKKLANTHFCVTDEKGILHISKIDNDVNAVALCLKVIKFPKKFSVAKPNCTSCLSVDSNKEKDIDNGC